MANFAAYVSTTMAFSSKESNALIFGIHPVLEAIESGKELEKVYIKKGLTSDVAGRIKRELRLRNVPLQEVPQEKLNRFTTKNHQGIVAMVSPIEYSDILEVVQSAFDKGEDPLVVVLDRVSDVGNFGAICRSAECAGTHGILVPARGSAQVNPFAVKSSAGAVFNINMGRSYDLKRTVMQLQASGLRIVACTEKANASIYDTNLTGPIALVMGSEEDGVSPELLAMADAQVKIPMAGATGSLNVSVATGILLFERLRQLRGNG